MRLLERVVAILALLAASAAQADDEPLLRWRAPIVVEQSAAFVRLPLPAQAYARSAQPSLQDLRVVDARGDRVPFALLAPRPDEPQSSETLRGATLYALPPRPSGQTAWASPVDVVVEGDRISVRRRAGAPAASANTRSPGWLVDLGERPRETPVPQSLRLQWSGPAEFSVGYTLELSDDLRQWRAGGSGQVMALASPGGALTQPNVPLPEAPARFVRLVWADVAGAPQLTGAQSVAAVQRSVMLDPPAELQVAVSPEPAGKSASDADARRALHFDLGAPLPIVQLDLALAATQVAPVRLQSRTRADEPWQALGGAVFYRLDRQGTVSRSPPLTVHRTARFVRVLPDERAGTLDPATRLVVRAQLSSVVFASQGEPPYALLAGSERAAPGALPLATLVPSPDEERARFGRATLGDWTEVTEAMRQAQAEQRRASLRPWLLWAVLLFGVVGLALMVWRLARSAAAKA